MVNNTIHIGFTKKPFGVKGELKLAVDEKYWTSLAAAKVVFLEIQGRQVPYFVETVRLESNVYIKFDEVDAKETASKLSSKKLFMRAGEVKEDYIETDQLVYGKCEGFTIIDQVVGTVGVILRVEEFPQQEMAMLEYNGNEIMIPLNDQLIQSIDVEQKELQMTLPEGLLELFS